MPWLRSTVTLWGKRWARQNAATLKVEERHLDFKHRRKDFFKILEPLRKRLEGQRDEKIGAIVFGGKSTGECS
uniref:Uncharacterized protein n=1 Tax=Hyaloperonospora arabidopsidis (strain Emoy2) TaxID=559515 RepID=M4BAD8_HYAAE